MSLILKTGLEKVDSSILNDTLQRNLFFTVYQSFEFYKLFKTQKNAIPSLFTVWDEERLTGSLIALRFSYKKGYPGFLADRTVIWGGPLLFGALEQQQKTLAILLDALIQECGKKSAIIEFRNMCDLNEFTEIFSKFDFHFSGQMNCIIKVNKKEDVIEKMKPSKFRQIRKGLERGAVITEAENIGQVKEFYEILKVLYSEKVKKPLPDLSFFESFYYWGKQSEMGVLLLVMYEGKVIGGSLCPITKDREIFEWYTGALTKEYKLLYPGVLATWAPIEYALNHYIPLYNLMGIGKPEIAYGVRNFKVQFGGDVVNYGRFRRINNPKLFKLTKAGYRLMGFRE